MAQKRVVVSGADDLAELAKIDAARPRGKDVIALAKKLKQVKLSEQPNGEFRVSTRSRRAAKELRGLFSAATGLEVDRANKLIAGREQIEVRNRKGQKIRLNVESEAGAGRADVIVAPSKTFIPPRGYPRCWDQGHSFTHGRCVWCGISADKADD